MTTHNKPHHGKAGDAKPAEHPPATEPAAEAAAPLDELAQCKVERADYLARLQRLSADFANYQKRASREVVDACEFANADLIKNLLPVLDDMERAIDAAKAGTNADDPLLVGMKLVHDKALATLKNCGVETIDAQGKPFDPVNHQAVVHMPSDKHKPGTVMQELQKGYILKGRLLRPATVVVSKAPEAEDA